MQDLIRLQLRGPASPKPIPVLVDTGRKISSQMEMMLRKLGLTPSPGEPPYDLHHAEGRSILDPALSFREAGVRENHVVVFLPRTTPAPAPTRPTADEPERFRAWTPPAEAVVVLVDAVEEVQQGKRTEFELENLLPAAQNGAATSKEKLQVLRVIRRFALTQGIPWAAQLLRDGDAQVRGNAVQVLASLQADDRLAELRPLLADPSGKVRGEAARAIARFEWEDSAPAILALLEDADPDARAGATGALGLIPVRDRESRLLRRLEDPDGNVRAVAVEELAERRSPALESRLEEFLRHPSEEVRRAACRAAGLLKRESSIPSLLRLLEQDREIAEAAMRALVELKARQASELIRVRLDEKYPWNQREALLALVRLGTVEPRDAARVAGKKDTLLSTAAIAAYRELNARAEIAPFLQDEDPETQAAACGALGGPEELRRLRTFLDHRLAPVRAAALSGLAAREVQEAATEITPLLLDANPLVRMEAVNCLDRLEYLPAARSIAALLADEAVGVRVMASAALRRLGSPDVCVDLLPHLSHPRSRVRLLSLRLLQEFDARDAAPAIERLLQDPFPALRSTAAVRLARLGSESSAPALRARLADPSGRVRWAAATALASFGDRTAVRGAFDPEREPESFDFALLNGAREPVLWKRLRDTRIASEISGTPAAVVAAIAERAGAVAELNSEFRERPAPSPEEIVPIRARSRTTLLTALLETVTEQEILLEAGRIRVVRKRDAAVEWKGWIG